MKRNALILLLLGSALVLTADLASEGKRWWSHVEYLASDQLEGRNTGSPGYRKAAEYVAQEFERVGLKPAGDSGPFQTVRFESRVIDEPKSSLSLVRDGVAQPLAIGDDAVIGLRGNPPSPEFEAPLYFVGYGLVVPEHKYSDFEGLDLKGKIIVAINGTPASLPGPLVSHYRTGRAAAPYLTNAGVAGAIGVANPRFMDVPWERSKLARVMPSMGLADRSMQEGAKLQISLSLNPASLDKLLEGSGHTTEELMALASAGKPLPKFPL
ncbi:MAG TPA: peptidase M28, partial [Bryobacteraceae bacterium]|nr:peptidase M28 [Bryobacteraceae bacterium]